MSLAQAPVPSCGCLSSAQQVCRACERVLMRSAIPNPAFNQTRRSELFFLGERRWRRAG